MWDFAKPAAARFAEVRDAGQQRNRQIRPFEPQQELRPRRVHGGRVAEGGPQSAEDGRQEFGPTGEELLDGAGRLLLVAGHAREKQIGGPVGATAGPGPDVVDDERDVGRSAVGAALTRPGPRAGLAAGCFRPPAFGEGGDVEGVLLDMDLDDGGVPAKTVDDRADRFDAVSQ
ncbi:hypothetical protein GCM10010299_08950 [Streptomyces tanashiensis]|nr:hypothetical protein GCM10010299_08950 [Streptomyces tanashiensis]